MKLGIPVFGIVLDGDISTQVIVIDRVSFMNHVPFTEEVPVCISALRENGKIVGCLDTTEFECADMGEALIEICSYCLKKLANTLKDRIHLKAEIDTLTAA
jgi:hypothetical protein